LVTAAAVKDSISIHLKKMQLDAMAFDCDACGCSASGGSMGFSSMLNSNFIGIRYFNQSYSSRDGILLTLLGLMKISIRLRFGLKIPVTGKLNCGFDSVSFS
jgi:hypothetical protein